MLSNLINYDEEADVLYVNLYDPPKVADDSERNGDMIIRKLNGQLIGITFLNIKSHPLWFHMFLGKWR